MGKGVNRPCGIPWLLAKPVPYYHYASCFRCSGLSFGVEVPWFGVEGGFRFWEKKDGRCLGSLGLGLVRVLEKGLQLGLVVWFSGFGVEVSGLRLDGLGLRVDLGFGGLLMFM